MELQGKEGEEKGKKGGWDERRRKRMKKKEREREKKVGYTMNWR